MDPATAPELTPGGGALATGELRTWVGRLAGLGDAADDGERIEQLRVLEEVKAACAAAQARVTVAFKASQLAAQEAAGVRAAERGRGIGAQVALARRESSHRGSRLVGLAEALVREIPATLAALEVGATSEWRATIVVRETACLSVEGRAAVDAELGPELERLGDKEVETRARAAAYRLEPHAFVERSRRAVEDRHVTSRPAPDTMCRLSALLPVAAGVATHVALRTHADALKAGGDARTLGQIMADTLVERVTGAAATCPAPITLDVLISQDTLLAGGQEPAHLIGYGPLPAPLARDLARGSEGQVFVRRLFTDPDDGALVAMESTARLFPEGLRRFLVLRDQTCRTPWCGAPIRHGDHVRAHSAGGPTTAANGQGLCAACNQAKHAPGWSGEPDPIAGAGAAVTITTPTGHTYRSTPPPPPSAVAPSPPSARTSSSPQPAVRTKPTSGSPPTRTDAQTRPARRPSRLPGHIVHHLTWEQLLAQR